jgi:hypothetical protein
MAIALLIERRRRSVVEVLVRLHMSLTLIGWLFVVGALVHNIEEALRFPAWSLRAGRWHAPVGPREFRFAVVVLSALLLVLALASSSSADGSVSAYLMAGYVLALVLNVPVPHVLATVFTRRYMPGTATAVVFNLPLGLLYLSRAFSEGRIELHVFCWSGPIVVAGIAASIPILFFLGRKWFPAQCPPDRVKEPT